MQQAEAGDAVYVKLEKPAFPGQVRMRSWRSLPGFEGTKASWEDRAAQYWELQAFKYGLKFADYRLDLDYVEGTPIITTSTLVLEVMPGRRVSAPAWGHEVTQRRHMQ